MTLRAFPALLLLAVACGDDPAASELDQSRDAFEARQADTPRYTYRRHFESYVGRFWYRTTITVDDGVVIERSYEGGELDEPATDSWTETGDDLGSHSGAHPVATMLELYDECETEILTRDPEAETIVFELDDDGLLRRCTATPNECEDDCTDGIDIESLEFGGCDQTSDCG
jgi:hypothetical protein